MAMVRKKGAAMLIQLIGLIGLLAACAGKETGGSMDVAFDPNEPAELIVYSNSRMVHIKIKT
jgi:hypothetical protein